MNYSIGRDATEVASAVGVETGKWHHVGFHERTCILLCRKLSSRLTDYRWPGKSRQLVLYIRILQEILMTVDKLRDTFRYQYSSLLAPLFYSHVPETGVNQTFHIHIHSGTSYVKRRHRRPPMAACNWYQWGVPWLGVALWQPPQWDRNRPNTSSIQYLSWRRMRQSSPGKFCQNPGISNTAPSRYHPQKIHQDCVQTYGLGIFAGVGAGESVASPVGYPPSAGWPGPVSSGYRVSVRPPSTPFSFLCLQALFHVTDDEYLFSETPTRL